MVTQVWYEGNKLAWRIILGSDHELHNGLLTIDFSDLISQGMIPELTPDPATGEVSLDYSYGGTSTVWLNESAGLDAAYRDRFVPIRPDGAATYENNVLSLSIPVLPAQGAVVFEIRTAFNPLAADPPLGTDYYGSPYISAVLDGTRYYMETHFTADTRCVRVEKTWSGNPTGGEQAAITLLVNGENLAQKARAMLPTLIGRQFSDRLLMGAWVREVDAALPGFFYQLAHELTFHEWVDLQGQPTGKVYTFTQAEADNALAGFLPLYEVELGVAPNNTHTFAHLPWLTPESFSLAENAITDGWRQQGEVTRATEAHRVLLGMTNARWTPTPAPVDYAPIHVPLGGQKQAVNHHLKGGEYRFVLKDWQGNTLDTASHDASGAFAFKPRSFSRTGSFLYTIAEVKGDNANIHYDSTIYTARVTVTAQGDDLSARVEWLKDGVPYTGDIRFVNQAPLPPTGDNHLMLPLALVVLALVITAGIATYTRHHRMRSN